MLNAFARHGLFDLHVQCAGDLHVDPHHSVEDVGICLGQAIDKALAGKESIERYGHSYVPMDEALARSVIDLSGRAYFVLTASFIDERIGEFPTALVREFSGGCRAGPPKSTHRPAALRQRSPRRRGHLQIVWQGSGRSQPTQ